MNINPNNINGSIREGLVAALMAYLFWGIFPIYFKIIDAVPSEEVFAHRIFWSVPFGLLILYLSKQLGELWQVLLNKKKIIYLALTSILISINWYIYIVAVQTDEILQASLGYYINPLMYVLVGILFLGEKLRVGQIIAILIATIGVIILALSAGKLPWISISLASSFTLYGVIRKKIEVSAMVGLFIETLFILPFAFMYILVLTKNGQLSFTLDKPTMAFLLIMAGPLTIFPLFFFSFAAKRLKLTTIGMMQFLSPSMQFVVAFIYGERLSTAGLICFVCIWVAITIFVYDALEEGAIDSY